MKRFATILVAMAAAIATLPAFAQAPAKASPMLKRLYGTPGPKVNFGSCQAPVAGVLLTPGSLAFGTVAAPNVTSPQRINVRNVGNNVLSIFSIDAHGSRESNPYEIVASTCGASLLPTQSCDVDIVYDASGEPGFAGAQNGVFTVFTNAPSGVAAAGLTATQVSQPVPQFDSLPVGGLDFGFVPQLTTTAPRTITIKNVGNAPMVTSSLATGNADFAITGHNCASVAPGGSCTANVTFSPSGPGGVSSFLEYRYAHPSFGPISEYVPIQGTGLSATADILVSPSSVSFGTITVGSGWSSGVDITNTGNTPLVITSYSIAAHFNVIGSTCPVAPAGLAPGATCNIAFDVDTSAPGFFSNTLTINNSSVANPVFGVPIDVYIVPDFTITPSFHDFGNVFTNPSTPPSVTVSLTNNDAIPEAVTFVSQIFSEITVAPGGPSPCPATIAPGQTCTFVITFSPTLPGGYFGPTVAIKDGNGTNTWYDFSAIGTGVASGPAVDFAPSFVDFGTVTAGSGAVTSDTTFTNVGNQAFTVGSLQIGAPFAAAPVAGLCPAGYPVIAPGESCRVRLTLTPPGSPDGYGDSLLVIDNANGAIVGAVDVFASISSAPAAAADFYPPSIDFGNVGVNRRSPPKIVSFGNTGSLPFTITGAVSVTGPFLLASTCPAVLNPGDCCALTLTYAPVAPGGPDTGTVTVNTDVAGTVTIPLQGVGVPPPSFDVQPVVLPATRTGFVTGPVAVPFTNTGVTTITITGISFSLPPAITTFDPSFGGGSSALPKAASPCAPGLVLPVGASCAQNFWFAPTAVQPYSGTYTIAFSGGTASPAVFPVLATGVPPTYPDIALSGDVVEFNGVVINTEQRTSVTITSTGTGPLQLNAITALGNGFTIAHNCPASLDPGVSCFVEVRFNPTALRAYSGDLVIEFEPAGSARVVKLLGTGVNVPKPIISLSSSLLLFNSQPVGGRSAVQTLLVRNIGTALLTVANVSASPGFVVETNACGGVAPGASCAIQLRFAPMGAGQASGVVAVTSNDPDRGTATATLSGVGCRGPSPSATRNLAAQCSQ